MPKDWMITDRSVDQDGLGPNLSRKDETLTFWISEGGALDDFRSWTEVSLDRFAKLLLAATSEFPELEQHAHLPAHW